MQAPKNNSHSRSNKSVKKINEYFEPRQFEKRKTEVVVNNR